MPETIDAEQTRVSPTGRTIVPEAQGPAVEVTTFAETRVLPIPREILFGAVVDRRFHFRKPMTLSVYREGESYIAYSADLQEFGQGDDVGEALDDFSKTLCELYFSLEGTKDRLAPDLQSQLAKVHEFIEVRRAA
jgi:hypothetical protein